MAPGKRIQSFLFVAVMVSALAGCAGAGGMGGTVVDFNTSYTSGGLAVDNRTGSATLVDTGSSWGLVGSGWAGAGRYNFDFTRPK